MTDLSILFLVLSSLQRNFIVLNNAQLIRCFNFSCVSLIALKHESSLSKILITLQRRANTLKKTASRALIEFLMLV